MGHRATSLLRLAFVVCNAVPLSAIAQQNAACKGPSELEQATATHPSAAAYDALGAYFAGHHQLPCAINTFESAVRLEPNSWEGHYDLGIALLSNRDPKRAAKELQTASSLQPSSPKILLPLGVTLSELGQQDAAIEAFRTILRQDPQSIPAIDGLTKALIAQKRYTAAIVELKAAPADEVLQLNLAIAYSKNGNIDEALQILSAIVKEHPEYAQAHSNLGIVYTQQKRFSEAAREFETALKLDPADDSVRLSYVKSLTALLQYDKAEPLIHEYLQKHPRDFEAVYFNGVVERGLGNYAEAERSFRQAVALNPNHAEAHYNLGFVLARQGKPAEARPELEKALQLNPESSEARFQLASVLRTLGQQDQAHEELNVLQQEKAASVKQDVAAVSASQANQDLQSGDPQKAVALYRASLANDPKNARTYYDLALALDRLSDYSAEQDALEKAQALDATLAPVHNQLGFLDLQAGHAQDAERQFKAAISLDPQYAEAQNNLGVLYGQVGKDADAEKMFRLATENNPQYGQAFANLGLILAGQGHLSEAESALSKAVQLDPKNAGALSVYGMVLVRLNRGAESLPIFRKVVELDPNSAGAHLNLGIALADRFDLKGALAEFSEAVRLDPNNAAAHYNKGRVLLDLQRNDEAKPELEAAVQLDPNQAESWYLLGLISRQADQTDEAIGQFEKAVAAKPDYAEAYFKLGQELQRKGDSAGAIKQWRKAIEIRPQYNEALYNLARLLKKSNPDEAARLEARFETLQAQEHITDRASTLGNFALASADAHDWPQAISQLKQALSVCSDCSALPLLHKDLGLIYCRAGDYQNCRTELLAAQRLTPKDDDILQALNVLDSLQKTQ
ncbi:tetratricopeptide repeat protein [Alloacidobacterium dinghuense]|uniref:Tetratricopeptide repeat protein n=1 Tax=Alloacidobacterium dinghuense TaxID=2763107 RepID=A0A7G8BH64_9BACT|nr:tetratricopeptide repeat protein [Alloacidobacterium dinghuense]QNI31884.1 tetratricopeptide repeat protein [Alloacidobacterium dinghuense]